MNDLSRIASQFVLSRNVRLSAVILVRDAEDDIADVVRDVSQSAEQANLTLAEIIVVDDGSRDLTWSVLEGLGWKEKRLRPLRLRRPFGAEKALMVGIGAATGDVIVTLDCSMGDSPEDIPELVALVEAGFDLVSGWNANRRKGIPAALSTWILGRLVGLPLRDLSSSCMAMNRDVVDAVAGRDKLESRLPVLAHALGFRVKEIAVHERKGKGTPPVPERSGFIRELIDVMSLLTVARFAERPGQIFGLAGAVLLGAGCTVLALYAGMRMLWSVVPYQEAMLVSGIMLNVSGVQLLLMGTLAHVLVSRMPQFLKPDVLVAKRKLRHGEPE